MSDTETNSKRSKGRPKTSKYLSFAEAREFILQEMIPSRSKYQEWWDKNQPTTIPRFPYRVYAKEWISWNDFLGTDNKFKEKKPQAYRSLPDCLSYVHTLRIKSQAEWLELCRQEPRVIPDDIPNRPDLVFSSKWKGWNHWLGIKAAPDLKTLQRQLKAQVFFVAHDPQKPENVLMFGVENGGLPAMKARWQREQFNIIRLFWIDQSTLDITKQIVDLFSRPYQGDERERITPNVWEIITRLEQLLSVVTPQQAQASAASVTHDPLEIT